MEPEKGYKVVRKGGKHLPAPYDKEGAFFSMIHAENAFKEYKVNKWTSRKTNCGPLALMPTYKLALKLAKECYGGDTKFFAIFEAEYVPSKVKDRLWYLKKIPIFDPPSNSEIIFGVAIEETISQLSAYISFISQTVLADKIKITKQLM